MPKRLVQALLADHVKQWPRTRLTDKFLNNRAVLRRECVNKGLKARRKGLNKLMKLNKLVVSRPHSLLAQLALKVHSLVFLRQMLRVN